MKKRLDYECASFAGWDEYREESGVCQMEIIRILQVE